MEWYLMVWKKYAQFTGRSRRKELWMFCLYNTLIGTALWVLGVVFRQRGMGTIIPHSGIGVIFFGLYFIYMLAARIPGWAVAVRRLHDTGKSGWWWLIVFVPFIGAIVLIVFWVLDSAPGANQYGPNPKAA